MSIQTNINNLHTNIEAVKNKISENEYQAIVTVMKSIIQQNQEEQEKPNNNKPNKVKYRINPIIQNELTKYWIKCKKFYPRDFLEAHFVIDRVLTTKNFWDCLEKYQKYIPEQEYSDLVRIVALLNDIQSCSNRTIYNNYMWFLDNNFANIINSQEGSKYISIFDPIIEENIKDKIKVKERNRTIKKVLTFGIWS